MNSMFGIACAFNGDLSRWGTSNVTTMELMFNNARAFNGDLSRWDTYKVTNMQNMFFACPIETSHLAVVRSATREGMTSKVKREKECFKILFSIWRLAFIV